MDGTLLDSMFIWDTIGEDYLRSRGIEPREDLKETFKNMSLKQAAEYYISEYKLPDSVQEANAIVSTGNSNATVMLPAMEHTIGNLKEVERVCGGNVTSIQPDGRLLLEIHGIMGSHNLQGNTKLGAITL